VLAPSPAIAAVDAGGKGAAVRIAERRASRLYDDDGASDVTSTTVAFGESWPPCANMLKRVPSADPFLGDTDRVTAVGGSVTRANAA
jgi:hypothetical protein